MFFWYSLAFSMIQWMLAIWSLVPLPFLKPAWTSGISQFTYSWRLAWRTLSIKCLAFTFVIIKNVLLTSIRILMLSLHQNISVAKSYLLLLLMVNILSSSYLSVVLNTVDYSIFLYSVPLYGLPSTTNY